MATTLSIKQRIQSIDILRGIIMLVMALDHVRDFLHDAGAFGDPTNLKTTTPILFFTRFVTHFCAPIFVFLSGVSVYLVSTRRTKSELTGFLIKRGLWLILVEIVLMSLAFSLNPLYNSVALQVIWAIGVSMILLALLSWLPIRVIGAIGILLIVGHDALTTLKIAPNTSEDVLMKIFFTARGSVFALDNSHFVFDLYAILPWTGVMFLGYLFGTLYKSDYKAESRKRFLMLSSLSLFAAFIVLRSINGYGDPAPWAVQKDGVFTFMSFINISKYPPSLMYCCLTLSVGLLILALTENASGKLAAFFKTYGSVPFFYYILHFYLIRLVTVAVFFIKGFKTSEIITPNDPFLFTPPGLGFNLGVVYLFWLGIILTLYYPCRWFSNYKKTHRQWWLSYL
ncbi:DUF1624 domain-containing protein [Mucilaginibacter conchicola]|uniref:DUF1624 domain-containing protein n=1 Tax=Mucilaginibacter conchicola TaxID=2303333 RepID=A0A372P054_9SPHI|nr:heparan-alpha-glucosaminide N-acetyltransferase domain-containing protein [Mucilaginibacter conchicola]RFZ95504.1 DUF1624 domain-containing protein [Mucilaginibacter conchicola]